MRVSLPHRRSRRRRREGPSPLRATTRRRTGSRRRRCRLPCRRRDLPVSTASVFPYDDAKIESNACEIESVRTNVPQTIATPSTIAIAVRAVRSLRLKMPRMENPVMAPKDVHRGRDLFHHPADLMRVALDELADDPTVGEEEHAMRNGGCARVMGDHHDRLPVIRRPSGGAARGSPGPRRRVEVAGRLVGEQHGPARDECTRNGDALLLATRELRRPVREPVLEAYVETSGRRSRRPASRPR